MSGRRISRGLATVNARAPRSVTDMRDDVTARARRDASASVREDILNQKHRDRAEEQSANLRVAQHAAQAGPWAGLATVLDLQCHARHLGEVLAELGIGLYGGNRAGPVDILPLEVCK